MDDYVGEWLGLGDYVGEIREGPDGQLYQWVEGIDGLGSPIGFWKAIRSVGRAIGKGVGAIRKVARLPGVRQLLPVAAGMIPGIGPAAAVGVRAAQSAGLLGEGDYVGEVRMGMDGNLYQWEEGIDGLGNAFGFWKQIKSVGRAIGKGVGVARKLARHPLVEQGIETLAPSSVQEAYRRGREAGLYGLYGDPYA